jgi:hypothetical protein
MTPTERQESGEQRGLWVWRCPVCGRTWHKSGAKPRNFCVGDGTMRHTGCKMEPIEVLPAAEARAEVERLEAALQLWLVANHGGIGICFDSMCGGRRHTQHCGDTRRAIRATRAALNPEQTGGTAVE